MMIILAGFLSGILSGMGVGGGMLLIPALTLFLGLGQHEAQSVNLFYFLPTAVAALIVHFRNKNVELRPAIKTVLAGLPFSLLGAWLAVRMSAGLLRSCFGVFVIIFGVGEIVAGIKSGRRNS